MNKRAYIVGVVAILVCVGAFLRFYRLADWMPWDDDVGRDMVVVQRMFLDHGPYTIRVTSGSSSGLVANSPVYYWVTLFLFVWTRSPVGISTVYVLWNILGIYFAYLLGKFSASRSVGLLYAALISTNYLLVKLSQKVWQQSILPTLTILSMLLAYVAFKKTSLMLLIVFIGVTFLGLHFHVSYYPVFIVNSFMTLILVARLIRKHVFAGVIAAGFYLTNAVVWFHIASPTKTINPLQHATWIRDKFSIDLYVHQAIDILKMLVGLTFFNTDIRIASAVFGISFCIFCFTVWKGGKFIKYPYILFSLLATIPLLAFYPEPFGYGRLMIYYPVILLMFALSMGYLIQQSFAFWLVVIPILYLSAAPTMSVLTDTPPKQLQNTELLAETIFKNYLQTCEPFCPSQPSFQIHSVETAKEQADWYTGQYWYYLEQMSGKKLVSIVERDNNLDPIIKTPRIRYLVCPLVGRPYRDVAEFCPREFTSLGTYEVLREKAPIALSLPDQLQSEFIVYRWAE